MIPYENTGNVLLFGCLGLSTLELKELIRHSRVKSRRPMIWWNACGGPTMKVHFLFWTAMPIGHSGGYLHPPARLSPPLLCVTRVALVCVCLRLSCPVGAFHYLGLETPKLHSFDPSFLVGLEEAFANHQAPRLGIPNGLLVLWFSKLEHCEAAGRAPGYFFRCAPRS